MARSGLSYLLDRLWLRFWRDTGALAEAGTALRPILGRLDLDLDAVVEGVASRWVGGDLGKGPEGASGVSPRATTPYVADGAIAAFEAESEFAAECGGWDKGVLFGALGAKREDLQDLFGVEGSSGRSSSTIHCWFCCHRENV
eukprot:881555-Rhodomonas_salina.1